MPSNLPCVATLAKRLEEAEAVIRPFADAAPQGDGNGQFEVPDGHPVMLKLDLNTAIDNGHLRAARRWMEGK